MSAGFLSRWVAVDEDGEHAEPTAEFNVGEGIAYDDAGFGCNGRKLGNGLMEESRERLAAIAFLLVVGAEVEAVEMRTGLAQDQLQVRGDGLNVCDGVEAEGDAALIGDDDDAEAGAVELCDCLGHAGEQMEFIPRSHVLSFGKLFVEDSVTIEEDRGQRSAAGAVGRGAHAVMITTGLPVAGLASNRTANHLHGKRGN